MRIQTAFAAFERDPAGDRIRLLGAAACAVALCGWAVLAADRSPVHVGVVALIGLAAAAVIGLVPLAVRTRSAAVPRSPGVPLSAVSDLVTWHDRFGDVVAASPSAQRLLGLPASSLSGGGLLSRVHVADRPAFLKALSDAANGRDAVTATFRAHPEPIAADGGRPAALVLEIRAQVVRGEDAAAGAVVLAFTRDVSAQTRHADEIEAARREAERANELKSRFLATVSHELRTPLNAIIGFSELLSADHPFLVTEERRKEYAGIIRSSGLHLLEIVNTLLDMSKIESGNFAFEPEPFSLRDLATAVCDLMQLKADEAGVTIERRFAADLPDLVADRRACRQVLINLLSNAVKFTPAGGRVALTLTATADAAVIDVSDTGIGIPEADLPRLGDPFFQSGELHRRNHEGTGLGLSVVRGIVGLHHGGVAVESGAGAGTSVTVTLPLKPELQAGSTRPVAVLTKPRVAARPLERKIA